MADIEPSRLDPRRLIAEFKALGGFIYYVALRFYKDRNFGAASSLSYTTLLAIVPIAAIGLSILAAFPVFDQIRIDLQQFVFKNLLPDSVNSARQWFDGFIKNTGQLTTVGIVVLAITALILLDTIDTVFNLIWRNRRVRPIAQRLTMYWAILTFTPLLAGGSIALSSYFLAATELGDSAAVKGALGGALQILPFILLVAALGFSYVVVPFKKVRIGHAAIGALVAGALFELLRWGFSLYFSAFPAYQTLYGALSTIPLFLVWMYLAWCTVLFGAQLTAAIPEWNAGVRRSDEPLLAPVRRLQNVLDLIDCLYRAGISGATVEEDRLMRELKQEPATLAATLERLEAAQMVARTDEGGWLLARNLKDLRLYELYEVLDLKLDPAGVAVERAPDWRGRLAALLDKGDTRRRTTFDCDLESLFGHAPESAPEKSSGKPADTKAVKKTLGKNKDGQARGAQPSKKSENLKRDGD